MKHRAMVGLCIALMGAALTLFGASQTAVADVPQLINCQGVLTDGAGDPITTSVSVKFAIYDAVDATMEAALWSETQTVTPDAEGRFNVLLGANTPIPDARFSGPDRWLGMAVGGEPEMTPRSRLSSVPYSNRVGSVDGASGGTIEGPGGLTINTGGLAINTTTSFNDIAELADGQRLQAEENGGARILGGPGNTPGSPAIGFFSIDGVSDDGGGNGIYRPAADEMAFATSSAERMRLDASGNIGIGVTGPSSRLEVNGPIATGVMTVTGNTTLDETASVVLVDNTANTLLTLPFASSCPGRRLTIKKLDADSAKVVTVNAATGDAIDADSFYPLIQPYTYISLVSDGVTTWYIVANWFNVGI